MTRTDAEFVARLRAICAQVGFEVGSVAPRLLERLRVLSERTQTVDDFERIAAYAEDVFRFYREHRSERGFGDVERRTIVLGCLFSDVGKTGPARADARASELIVDMFSIEGVRDDQQPVSRFFATYFPADAEDRIARFAALGLDAGMTMRQFWNLHTSWTLELISDAGIPIEAVAAAASHHLLDDVNPQSIVGADQRFTRWFGVNTTFDRAEKLVILLDKYDAVRRRGRLAHGPAIAWLRGKVARMPRFAEDPEFRTLIDDLDLALAGHGAPERSS